MQSKQKVVIITGGAGGIGTAIANECIKRDMRCVLADINKKRFAELQRTLKDNALCIYCDITDSKSVRTMVRKVIKKYGTIDILINNAGIIEPALFEDASYSDIIRQIQVNLMGPINCAYEMLPYLKKSKSPCIVTISSLAGIVPETYGSIYTATKFALRGLCLTLHIELKKHGIHVATVFPDSVNTPMLQYEASHGGSPLTFLSKPQSPYDVAKAVMKAIDKKRVEVVVPSSQAFITRFIMVFPSIVANVWPLLEKIGNKNKIKFRQKNIYAK